MKVHESTLMDIQRYLAEQGNEIISSRAFKLINNSFAHETTLPTLFEELGKMLHSHDPPILLEKILLASNSIANIPEEIQLICSNNTKTLDLSKNNLKEIPPEIFRMAYHVEHLNLSHNRLQTLPSQMDQFRNLKSLDLRDNQIGYIPPILGELLNLENINVDANPLFFPSQDELLSFAGPNDLKAFLVSNCSHLEQRIQQQQSQQQQQNKRPVSPTATLVRNRSFSDSRGKSLKASRRMGLIINSNKSHGLAQAAEEFLDASSNNNQSAQANELKNRTHTSSETTPLESALSGSPLNLKKKSSVSQGAQGSEGMLADLHEVEQKPSAYFRRLSTLQEVPADDLRHMSDRGDDNEKEADDVKSSPKSSLQSAPNASISQSTQSTSKLTSSNTLVASEGDENLISLHTVVRVARKILFSLSELHSSVKRLTGFCIEKKVLNKVISLLRSTKENIDNLVETMEFVEGKNRDPELVMSALHTCIRSFKLILSTILDLYSSFVLKIDVCFVRMVYLSVYGSLNEIQNAYKLITSGQKSVLSKLTEINAGDSKLKTHSTNLMENSVEANQPVNENNGPSLHSASEIVPSLDEVDEKLYQAVELATLNAQVVFNELSKAMNRSAIANATSTSSQTISSLVAQKFKELTNVCMTLMDITKRLKAKLTSIRLPQNLQYRRQFWDDINLFLKAIIQTFSSVKVIMKDAPILNEVRQSMANLTKTTKDLTILLEASSYKSFSESQQPSPFSSQPNTNTSSSVLHSTSHVNLSHLNNPQTTAVRTPLGATVGAAAAQAILTPSEPYSAGGQLSANSELNTGLN